MVVVFFFPGGKMENFKRENRIVCSTITYCGVEYDVSAALPSKDTCFS